MLTESADMHSVALASTMEDHGATRPAVPASRNQGWCGPEGTPLPLDQIGVAWLMQYSLI